MHENIEKFMTGYNVKSEEVTAFLFTALKSPNVLRQALYKVHRDCDSSENVALQKDSVRSCLGLLNYWY